MKSLKADLNLSPRNKSPLIVGYCCAKRLIY